MWMSYQLLVHCFSVLHYISANVCTVFKWWQLDIARNWTKRYLWRFSWFCICQIQILCEEQCTDQQIHHQYFPLYSVLLFQKLYVLLKAITSHAIATKIRYKAIQNWQTRGDVFLTLKSNIAEYFQNLPSVQNPRFRQRVTIHF